jgi:hypothetical protein
MIKTAILFSCYVPDTNKLWIEREMLDQVRSSIDDCVIFAGVNPSKITDEVVGVLSEYTNHINVTPNHLVINSDASSYQSALRGYKPYIGQFDIAIFIHPKGITSGQHGVRRSHLKCLLSEYSTVKKVLGNNDLVGSYGYTLLPVEKEELSGDAIWETLSRYCEWKCKPFKWFFACTMYAIKAHILDSFLKAANDDFLNAKLTTSYESNGDRYFFERDFGGIVSRAGYVMRYKSLINCIPGFVKRYGRIQGAKLEEVYQSELKIWAQNNGVQL